ncbi:MAG: phosphatidylglycerophosphatase A [Pseudomonadales bacterium]|nr:phosphatidylglycerophosphatase A [Pseudomonadales bacterium]
MQGTPASVWRNPVHFLAFGFGSGASPVAPGTCGSILAMLLYLLLPAMPTAWYLLLVLAAALLGVYLCARTARDIGVHDHGGIVWDEFVGYWLTMVLAPPGWLWAVLGLVLFRIFDIAKPWPIAWLDAHVEGGIGIMIDDVLAGLMALVCLQLVHYLI